MRSSAHETYLATQVQTASPQKLQLMLIDGAIRWAETTKRLWQENKNEEAVAAAMKCHRILGELLANVRSNDSNLARKVASVYAYLFWAMTEALRDHDSKKIDHVLSVLQIERETWRQVCATVGAEKAASDKDTLDQFSASATKAPKAVGVLTTPKIGPPAVAGGSPPAPPGISLEV